MKKLTKLLCFMCVLAATFSCVLTANAAIPTALTFKQVATAPAFDGSIDTVYGQPIFDFKATDIQVGNYNLYPRTQEELDPLKEPYQKMHSKGYAVFDEENLYLAFDVKDTVPRAAANSANYYESTNIQLVFYVNEYLAFPTIAYAGKNKVRIWDDKRSEMDINKMKAVFVENGGNFIYEVKIPWSAFPDVRSLADVSDIRMGYIQTSMAVNYLCAAFGEAYDLDYDKLLPVTLNMLATPKTSSTNSQKTGSTNSSNTNSADSSKTSSVDSTASDAGVVGSGVDIPDDTQQTRKVNSSVSTVAEEGEKDYTLFIVLAAVGGLLIVGGVVAIILLNKKKPQE